MVSSVLPGRFGLARRPGGKRVTHRSGYGVHGAPCLRSPLSHSLKTGMQVAQLYSRLEGLKNWVRFAIQPAFKSPQRAVGDTSTRSCPGCSPIPRGFYCHQRTCGIQGRGPADGAGFREPLSNTLKFADFQLIVALCSDMAGSPLFEYLSHGRASAAPGKWV